MFMLKIFFIISKCKPVFMCEVKKNVYKSQ